MIRTFQIAALINAAFACTATDAAAQFNYGGGSGTSSYYGGGFSGGFATGHSGSYDYGMPYYSHGYSVGPYSSNFNTTPSYTYSTPYVIQGYQQQIGNYITRPVPAPAAYSPALLTVELPAANAQVWLENRPTTSQGMQRRFESPPLEPGQGYTYTVKARWQVDGKTVESTREVKIRAGQTSAVDFRESPVAAVPPAAK